MQNLHLLSANFYHFCTCQVQILYIFVPYKNFIYGQSHKNLQEINS